MRVGFDISQMAHTGGVATYTQKLTDELSKIRDIEMVYFYSSLRKPYNGLLRNVKSYRLPPKLIELLFNRWRRVPIEKFIGKVDTFHSSDWTQPRTYAKKVTTYHDLVPIKYPQWSTPKIISVHKRRLKIVEQEIDMVIAVSESTKRDLLEVSKIPEDKITVIYEGPSADFKEQSEEKLKAFKNKYNLPEKFVLAIGGIGERRNLKRITDAAKDYNLIITGQTIPWLSIEDLELLYQSASVLIYASLYEGFGIPILDAFLSGCPVITSNNSSIPEVGQDAVMYVDPLKVEDIKKKIDMLMKDKTLRDELKIKGLRVVKQFSWEKCARQTAAVYRSLMK